MSILKSLFFLLFASPLFATPHDTILDGMTPGSITFIGESHKHVESPRFIKALMAAAVERGQCPTLALEIADSEQPAIDRAMTQATHVAGIKIPAMIDHSAMRKMLKDMAALKKQSPCLNVIAIDAGADNPIDRDEWMAARLTKLAGDQPVLVLIGGLHTLKKVDWLVKTGKPSVAERLATKGFAVHSFPQRWIPDQCGAWESRKQRFVSAEKPEALAALNDSMMSLINAKPHESTQGVIDGLILWECADSAASNI